MPGARRLWLVGVEFNAPLDTVQVISEASKTTHGLDGQHQDVDRTLRTGESLRTTEDRDKWRKYVHGVANARIEDG